MGAGERGGGGGGVQSMVYACICGNFREKERSGERERERVKDEKRAAVSNHWVIMCVRCLD